MAQALGKIGWKIIGYGFAIPTGIFVRKALTKTWMKQRGTPPPSNPEAPGTQWREALVWAGVSGVLVALGRLIASAGAAKAYKTLTGKLPPGLESAGP
ncbi:MAG: DUF4235 domain-containing protein [Geodermatophilaceae bacterium]|nr:DUF4235 domain-containing protein [Geodermatophilaceae bacterium]